jgi:hypothetical protein
MRGTLQRQPNLVSPSKLPQHAPLQHPHVPVPQGTAIYAAARDLKSRPLSRVGFDFGSIRIFPDSPHVAVTEPGVLAATLGDQVHLAPALAAMPVESQRTVLAHEFAHVAQQHNASGSAADEAALEREAEGAGRNLLSGRALNLRLHASATEPHYYRVKVKSKGKDKDKEYEIGDVVLNSAAHKDIVTSGSLIEHQGLIVYDDGSGVDKLGYEVGYANPEDPFRWDQIKSIVDKEHIDIRGVGATDEFKVSEVIPPKPPATLKLSLFTWPGGSASGVTLPTLARQQAIDPAATAYVASADPKRDQIYYETGKGGSGLRGSNSLAHELFGHFGLARQGAAWEHNAMVAASPQVSDPFGQPFVGKVDDYIKGFAEAETGVGSSPTRFVSAAFLTQALKDLAANGEKGLTRTKTATTDGYTVSADWKRIWIGLSQNYRALGFTRVPPPAAPAKATPAPQQGGAGTAPAPAPSPAPTTTPSPAPATTAAIPLPAQSDIEAAVLKWFGGLSADGKWVFQEYLSDESLKIAHEAPTELLFAVMAKLPKPAASTPAPSTQP